MLVADEPTGQLDHGTVDSVLAAFTALALAIPVIMGIAIWALPKQER